MGYEYRLSFIHPGEAAVAASLAQLDGRTLASTEKRRMEFRREPLGKEMPDATAIIEEYGLYFCNHGGHGREYLGVVLTVLVENFGAVTVENLE